MPLTLDQLREELLALPDEDRNRLILSLPDNDEIVPLDLHPAWAEELRFRRDELNTGRMDTIPWETVEKELDSLDDLP
jgi:putative addiction module component (TIGR02574 family)